MSTSRHQLLTRAGTGPPALSWWASCCPLRKGCCWWSSLMLQHINNRKQHPCQPTHRTDTFKKSNNSLNISKSNLHILVIEITNCLKQKWCLFWIIPMNAFLSMRICVVPKSSKRKETQVVNAIGKLRTRALTCTSHAGPGLRLLRSEGNPAWVKFWKYASYILLSIYTLWFLCSWAVTWEVASG